MISRRTGAGFASKRPSCVLLSTLSSRMPKLAEGNRYTGLVRMKSAVNGNRMTNQVINEGVYGIVLVLPFQCLCSSDVGDVSL